MSLPNTSWPGGASRVLYEGNYKMPILMIKEVHSKDLCHQSDTSKGPFFLIDYLCCTSDMVDLK